MKPTIKMVACVLEDLNYAIGMNGGLIFSFSEDMKHFKSLTMNQPVIMGRKTFESIGGKLDNRLNIIMTSNVTDTIDEDIIYVNNIKDAIRAAYGSKKYNNTEISVIGGESVYKQFINLADYAYITRVFALRDIMTGASLPLKPDTFFPKEIFKDWEKVNVGDMHKGDPIIYDFRFQSKVSKDIPWNTNSYLCSYSYRFETYTNPNSPYTLSTIS